MRHYKHFGFRLQAARWLPKASGGIPCATDDDKNRGQFSRGKVDVSFGREE